MSKVKPRVLFVDDDVFLWGGITAMLTESGFVVDTAGTLAEAKRAVEKSPPDLAIIDIRLPPGEGESMFETKAGFECGVTLAQWLQSHYPSVSIIGFSLVQDPGGWFESHGFPFVKKFGVRPQQLVAAAERAVGLRAPLKRLRTFIVHGHDELTKLELKNYLQNTVGLEQPIILHEQPNDGRTLIEKLEEESRDVDGVFVLLTPDDPASTVGDSQQIKRRARQNVIFELGFFVGSLGRRSGRVILLHKGPIELPSDLSGVVYIDISRGIEFVAELIRREIARW